MFNRITAFALMLGLVGCIGLVGCSSQSSKASNQTETQAQTTQPAETAQAQKTAESNDAKYVVTIDSCEITEDYQGNPAALVTYTFTNNSDEAKSFMVAIADKAYQNGVQLDTAVISGVDNNSMKDVKPGATITVQQGFKLDDDSDMTVEVEELFNFRSDELLAEKTFSIG